MENENKNALTAQEVADLLKIAKNTVYEMIKRGEINSYKVGRKVRFTMSDVNEYISRSKSIQPSTDTSTYSATLPIKETSLPNYNYDLSEPNNKNIVICGQDIMLDVLSNYIEHHPNGGSALRSYIGSYSSLIDLYYGKVQVASAHLWDSASGEYNIPHVRSLLPGISTVIIHLTCRMQGLYVAKGNPKNISGWQDFLRKDITMINREKGAGSRVLLDEHLKLLGVYGSSINGYQRESQSHLAVASTIARKGADVAVGHERIARQVDGIDFIPLQKERYDLVIRKEDLPLPQIQALLEILRSKEFQDEFTNIGGYEISEMGKIVAET